MVSHLLDRLQKDILILYIYIYSIYLVYNNTFFFLYFSILINMPFCLSRRFILIVTAFTVLFIYGMLYAQLYFFLVIYVLIIFKNN